MHCSYTRADTSNADIEACSAEYTDLDMNLNDTNIVLTKDIGMQKVYFKFQSRPLLNCLCVTLYVFVI